MCLTKDIEKIKTHISFPVKFSENRAVYEIMWKNMVELDSLQMTIWRMRFTCWVPKATHTHTHTHTQNM